MKRLIVLLSIVVVLATGCSVYKLDNTNISKNIIPNIKPIVAGNQAIMFCSFAISIDGISKDQTEAATITPEANPNNTFSNLLLILFFIRKTIPAPNVDPKNGINNPINIFILFIAFQTCNHVYFLNLSS